MLSQLGITGLRPGPSGDPKAPNAANSDESRATAYDHLPDPLQFVNGARVTNQHQWQSRRKELIQLFDKEIYGVMPDNTPAVNWRIIKSTDSVIGGLPVIVQEITGHVDNSRCPRIDVNIEMTLVLPQKSAHPVPVIIHYGFRLPPGMQFPEQPSGEPALDWKEQCIRAGYGFIVLIPASYQADNGAGLRSGIIGLMNKGDYRKPGDWGTLRAWAWGASRVLDYLEKYPAVAADKVAIEGLSRYGKAALVTMAYDRRFSAGFIGSSGAGGGKILRRQFGEQVENLCSAAEYHWFAGNFIRYAGPLTPADLPVDAHELVALAAPRPIFIGVGNPAVEGNWIDAKGLYLAAVYASPVYDILHARGLVTPSRENLPPLGTLLDDGDIAFRQHFGGHTNLPNWSAFLVFVNKYWEKSKHQ
ncbi:hypothetical protein FPE01S_01_16600 [Flavihumibacter petaseus NBRC 106054]|uniref:4-O-methyl-glucuronoyl methylesterase-like domain-containing protein n=2 Tax=Flavihumibacter TaxID=1004301 RepID=A0A0E9MZU1_9BACT|nr:hypothetical protein FPE01S_01_16600 [Flavihumibacter petaseus NBRC 106054]